jgi:hydroxymethylbilane synthase
VNGVQTKQVRIGTRGSALARWQARAVQDALMAAHGLPDGAFETVVIRTSGDRIADRALLEASGKGLFTKEIEDALTEDAIDIAVHSAKDVPTVLPDGLVLAAYLEREDPRDAFVAAAAARLEDLPPGACIGTASLRRQALVKRARPDIEVGLLRGNVPTRIQRIEEGAFDATLLALAGLKRLGLADRAGSLLDLESFPPACGQGAIAIECRADDRRILDLLAGIGDRDTAAAITCERGFLEALDGSCRTPIAGHAVVSGTELAFYGLVITPDGTAWHEERMSGPLEDAAEIGRQAGETLKQRAPAAVLAVLGFDR